jgi:hypothetical protein
MKRLTELALAAIALILSLHATFAQSERSGVERLYILNCGEGVAGDISRWSPGVDEGKSMDFVDTCYLIRHAQGWFLPTPRPSPGGGRRRLPRSSTSSA